MSVEKALLILTLLVLTLLAAAGCTKPAEEPVREQSAPQGSAVRTPAAAPAPSRDERPVIVTLGDSLAEGLGVEPGRSFPDQLQAKLDRAGYRYRVVNLGVSGDTTTGGLGRLDYVVSLQPAIVILELGGNDGLRGVPVSSTKANLGKMIVRLKESGAEILLAGMTLPPNYGSDYIRQFEKAYKDLARQHSLRLIPFLMEDILRQIEADPGLMQRDGIHPTATGHAVIADTVMKYLKPMLRKQS